MSTTLTAVVIVIVALLVVLGLAVRIVKQYERGVLFRFGSTAFPTRDPSGCRGHPIPGSGDRFRRMVDDVGPVQGWEERDTGLSLDRAYVRHQLEIDGRSVTITDMLGNETDPHVTTVLAEAVRGVTVVHVADEAAPR